MTNKFVPNKPDLKGKLDVAAWFNKDEEGKTFLTDKLNNNVKLYLNKEL